MFDILWGADQVAPNASRDTFKIFLIETIDHVQRNRIYKNREAFASMFLQAILSNSFMQKNFHEYGDVELTTRIQVGMAIEIADRLIDALNKQTQEK